MTAEELAAKAGTQISKAEQYMRDPQSVSRPTRNKLDAVLGIKRKHGGARTGKRGRHKVQRTSGSDRFADYENQLSRQVNKACKDWLRGRGMGSMHWKDRADAARAHRQTSKHL